MGDDVAELRPHARHQRFIGRRPKSELRSQLGHHAARAMARILDPPAEVLAREAAVTGDFVANECAAAGAIVRIEQIHRGGADARTKQETETAPPTPALSSSFRTLARCLLWLWHNLDRLDQRRVHAIK